MSQTQTIGLYDILKAKPSHMKQSMKTLLQELYDLSCSQPGTGPLPTNTMQNMLDDGVPYYMKLYAVLVWINFNQIAKNRIRQREERPDVFDTFMRIFTRNVIMMLHGLAPKIGIEPNIPTLHILRSMEFTMYMMMEVYALL